MTLRKIMLASAALLLPTAGLLGWHLGYFSPIQPDPWRFITDAGYDKLAPPSRLVAPGAIATVEILPDGSVSLFPTCRMDNDALIPLTIESDTVAGQFGSRTSESFSAESDVFGAAAAKATGNRVKQVSVALSNMKVLTVAHDDLIRVWKDHLKGLCEEAIMWHVTRNQKVCQVSEVLRADVVYRVSFADALDSTQRAELAKEVKASLNIGADFTGVDEMRGENLYFGVRANLRCFELAGLALMRG